MPHTRETAGFEGIAAGMPPNVARILSRLHEVATSHGCAYRVLEGGEEAAASELRIIYSARSLTVTVKGGQVSLDAEYDIRAFLEFYRGPADQTARELLFEAARSCEYCINDKCTTLLSDRFIRLGERRKKLCGPYRHTITLGVTPANLEAVAQILAMVLRYCTPEMHVDLFRQDARSCTTRAKPELAMIGYAYAASALSIPVERFIQQCLSADQHGRRKVDELLEAARLQDPGSYIGVTSDFVNGACFSYTFGVLCPTASVPAALPKGVRRIRIPDGEWAVWTSSARDEAGIWKEFSETYFDREHRGFDTGRPWFETYDRDGNLAEVGIPVSADSPKDSGRRTRVLSTPDLRLAGVMSCCEKDHALYKETAGIRERLREAFPHAERIVTGYLHAELGRPMMEFHGVEVDALDLVPDDLEVFTVRGGYWNAVSYSYPRRGDWEFDPPYTPRFKADMLNHPRAFMELTYPGRMPSSEIYCPVRLTGDRTVEIVERPPTRLVGKEERPPADVVSDAELQTLCDLGPETRRGACTVAFKYEMHGQLWFFQKPVIKGAEVPHGTEAPAGMTAFTLEGGRYARISETRPNGGYDWWAPWYVFKDLQRETGYEPDLSRLFFVEQSGYGRQFVLYAPLK